MIKGLGLSNFKAFEEMEQISFKKMNVFLGPNSSGKSSFIRALTILKDSLNATDSNQPIVFNENTGDYKSLVYGGHLNKKMNFEILLEQNETILSAQRSDVLKSILFMLIDAEESFGDLNKFSSVIQGSFMKYENTPVYKLNIELKSTKNSPCMINSVVFTYKDEKKIRIFAEKNSFYIEYKGEQITIPNLFVPYKFLFKFNVDKVSLIDESLWNCVFEINVALENIKHELKNFFKNYYHIGPYRVVPNRIEMITSKSVNSVGHYGENLIPALLSLFKDTDQDKSKLRQNITKWLQEFGIASGLEIVNQSSINRYSLNIKNSHTGIKSNIVDVGTGTSQILPFIVESVMSPPDSILVIEEPESHIHPNAQATLADLFTEKIKVDNKTFFLETHSMYLLQKIQILVAEKKLSPNEVGIFYFNQTESGSEVLQYDLNEDGQFIKDFPKGFYDVAYNLTTELMNAIWGD